MELTRTDHDGRRDRLNHDWLRPPEGEQHHSTAPDGVTYSTGTTIVGVTTADAAILAADQRMSLGGRFTANKNAQKVEQVHPTGAIAISGSVGPAQRLIQSLRTEANLYEVRRGEPMSLRGLSQTTGHLVSGLPVAPLLAGVDQTGPQVYELDGGGSVLRDDYAAGGSGMQVAYGVLERRFDPDASTESARRTAVDAVAAASERDTASGNGVHVATITAEGVDIDGADDPEEVR
ncbi:proteasome beta subunit [Halogranum rubrum]|uniref:proteasome endopeptidase complex n=1 Tax=Halogranum rubrum TaxID=553466 RepID=A0A1I4I4R6_9EURY|nr:proteasome subunit beta [Halogranum rubrum]SFL49478.1 proteasome beta subunit [Halogranum rubrum]